MEHLINESTLRQAMARGYCTKENENKEIDPELIEAMLVEIKDVVCPAYDSINMRATLTMKGKS